MTHRGIISGRLPDDQSSVFSIYEIEYFDWTELLAQVSSVFRQPWRRSMNITTSAQDFEMSQAIDRFSRDQVLAALQRFSEDIIAVDVFMKDCNGPKGGVDKQVLIRVRLRNRQAIALETAHENLYAAVRKGCKRTQRTVRRHLRKAQRIQKQRMRDHLDDAGIPVAT
jgi:ribosome-associated translation inhibitor RaiA